MTKLKKQIITVGVLAVLLIALGVVYFTMNKDANVLLKEPVVNVVVDGDKLNISGFKKGSKYSYSSDNGVTWKEFSGETLALPTGKIYAVKEILKDKESPVTYIGPYGETMKNGRPFIVDDIENEVLDTIEVHNTLDEYTMVHKESGAYKISGLEGYEEDEMLMPLLRVNATHLLALRFIDNAELDNLEQYGINKEDPAVWFKVTYNKGQGSYKILVGDKTPDEDGYYAMLEGRDAVYVIDTGIESCILQPKIAYVTPKFVDTVESNYLYTLKDFVLNKNGEHFLTIEKSVGDVTYGNNSSHRLTYPAYNYATNMANFEAVLTALSELKGASTLYYGDSITDELLCELGFFDAEGNDTADFSLKYAYPAFSEYLYIMKDVETGDYMVYSLKENIIVSVPYSAMAFLEWEMLQWVSAEIYMLDIEDIATVEFVRGTESAKYILTGEADTLAASCNNIPVDINGFKELYKSIMYVLVTAYAKESTYGGEQLGLIITTEKGEVLDYRFYTNSATNSYYTLNGFGEFYVSADKVLAMRDAAFALAGK